MVTFEAFVIPRLSGKSGQETADLPVSAFFDDIPFCGLPSKEPHNEQID